MSRVVGERFYVPPAMLARILREADPDVTCGGGFLRFEGFSACASVHVRVDVAPDAYRGDVLSPGTTNVDFNETMRGALAGLRDGDPVELAVGRGEVELRSGDTTIVEKRVPLPLRWLRGFVEVQAYQSRMKPLVEASGIEALRFLRALPRTTTARHTVFVTGAGRALRTSTVASRGAVRVSGLQRLRVVEDLAPLAKRLVIHAAEAGQASAWVLELPDMRITLTLSGDVSRGFSGEGQALEALAAGDDAPQLASIRAELRWQATWPPGSRPGASPSCARRRGAGSTPSSSTSSIDCVRTGPTRPPPRWSRAIRRTCGAHRSSSRAGSPASRRATLTRSR